MGKSKRSVWVADFETTTTPEDCRVWGWGLANVETCESVWDVEIGQDIAAFINRVSPTNSIVYFHNLKFDGFFILDYLFRNGYVHVDKYPRPGEITSLISNMGMFYSITVSWVGGGKTEFRDSHKKLPYSVSTIAKAFNLPESKGELAYETPRPVGHVITQRERAYIVADVLIVTRALKVQFDTGMTKLTVGADSLAEFKKIIGKRSFDKLFPVLPKSMDDEIRRAYRGGFTYSDERFQGRITGCGRTYDVNSLYPSVMYDRLLPYGEPVFFPGAPEPTPDRPLYVVSVTFTAALKKNHIPCIQVKGSSRFLATEYQKVISDPVTLTCTNVDLDLWMDHYDIDILSFNGGWLFRGIRNVFKEYIDKWMDIKKNSTGGMRELAKLHLNSLYGKFATNPDVTPKIPGMVDDVVTLTMGPEETRDPVYTAMGVFITAYARDVTIRAAQQHYPVFAYADTDSLHLLTDTEPETLDVHPKRLGAWKFEYAFVEALFIRAKTYIEHVGAHHCKLIDPGTNYYDPEHECKPGCAYESHIAGLPVKISAQLTIDDFVGGRRFAGKLNPRRVPGGIVLEDVGYTLPTW